MYTSQYTIGVNVHWSVLEWSNNANYGVSSNKGSRDKNVSNNLSPGPVTIYISSCYIMSQEFFAKAR